MTFLFQSQITLRRKMICDPLFYDLNKKKFEIKPSLVPFQWASDFESEVPLQQNLEYRSKNKSQSEDEALSLPFSDYGLVGLR